MGQGCPTGFKVRILLRVRLRVGPEIVTTPQVEVGQVHGNTSASSKLQVDLSDYGLLLNRANISYRSKGLAIQTGFHR